MLRICAYVQDNYPGRLGDKQKKGKLGEYLTGLRVIAHALETAGYKVDFASKDSVSDYYVVLASITGDKDWMSFLQERVRWPKGKRIVIVGGAAALNARPFLSFADCFVLGRGERLIVDIMRGIEAGDRLEDDSVIWSDSFSMDKTYRIRQEPLYPHVIEMSKGFFKELSMGCHYKCKFCAYAHHRMTAGDGAGGLTSVAKGFRAFGPNWQQEQCLLDIMKNKEAMKPTALQITAMDGFSERLRRMVGKPITREILRGFLARMMQGMPSGANKRFKLYNIVGLPTEAEEDWAEFMEDLGLAEAEAGRCEGRISVELHSTPFRAVPATPAACWPMPQRRYKGEIGPALRRLGGKPGGSGLAAYEGEAMAVYESAYTEGLAATILAAVALRGTEADGENLGRLAWRYGEFERQSDADKTDALAKGFDIGALFGAFAPDELPTRNIKTWLPVEKSWPL